MAENEKWITLKSGKKVKLDENGTVIAGFQGFMGKNIANLKEESKLENKPYSKPGKNFETYLQENGNDKTKAARQFFRENLQDKYIATTINGQSADVHFTGKSWEEFKKYINKNEIKANFLEDVPNVLQNYKGSAELTKGREDFSKFHYFEQTVEKNINGKPVKAKIKVDVGEKEESTKENLAYNYKVDKIAQDTKKASVTAGGCASKETPPLLLQLAFDKTIRNEFEVVNIEIEVSEDQTDHGMALDINKIKKEVLEEMRETEQAVCEVEPLVGKLDSLAFDSAGNVYLEACKMLGVQATRQSACDVCHALLAVKRDNYGL